MRDALAVIHGPMIDPLEYTYGAPMDWVEAAFEITGGFEGSNFRTITGDFDGMGISAGVLQWNYGQGSLQTKILQPYINLKGTRLMDSFFPEPISKTATMTAKEAVAFARKVMLDGKKLKAGWGASWQRFLSQEIIKEIQLQAARSIASRAYQDAVSNNLRSKRAFCWFFDVHVQNGSMKGINKPELTITQKVGVLIKGVLGNVPVVGEVVMPFPVQSEYLANITQDPAVSVKNRKLWTDELQADDEECIILFNWMLKRVTRNDWAEDVVSRKGTIAHKIGYVHGQLYDLREVLS
jgi:hypothetical protein